MLQCNDWSTTTSQIFSSGDTKDEAMQLASMLHMLSLAIIIASCDAFSGLTRPHRIRRTVDNAIPNSLTKLNSGFLDTTTEAIQNVVSNPGSILLPIVLISIGSVLPILVKGFATGESVYSLLIPAIERFERIVRRLPFVEAFILQSILKEDLAFKGVRLPLEKSEFLGSFLSLTGTSQFTVLKFVLSSSADIDKIAGREKADAESAAVFSEFHNDYVNYAIKPNNQFDIANTLPEGYKYFGHGDNFKNLPYFMKTNPFFAASLRSKGSGFEIDPFGKSGETMMSQLIACFDDRVPRVEASFDADMNLIGMKVFNATDPNVELTGFDEQTAATALLYQCTYYAQNIHATTHIFHLLMTTGIVHSTLKTDLEPWATPYVLNIYLKYVQVERLLFSENGYLTGTGEEGYRIQNRAKVLEINRAMLCKWGAMKTANEYISDFLFTNIDPTAMKKAGLCEEFLKHVALISPYATAMDNEFKKNTKTYDGITNKLTSYMASTGEGVSSVDNTKTWMELMSVSGILHGSTLSMSRLMITHSMTSINTPESSTFTKRDVKWNRTLVGTILGALEDFHVFSNTLPSKSPYNVNRVLLEFDAITQDIKAKYFKEISKDAEIFDNYGWILTDHGPNFVDGKQHTITTYI